MVNSRIFRGQTTHARQVPVPHQFRYRLFWFGIDLDELEDLDRKVKGFSHNRRGLLSIRDEDYGGPGDGSIRDRIVQKIQKFGISKSPSRIMLMTIPRVAGYVFNPVNFYMCYGDDGDLCALVCEVRNTFGEKHHYVASPDQESQKGNNQVFYFQKRFYVSPFIKNEGEYKVVAYNSPDVFRVSIELTQNGERTFTASMSGKGTPITKGSALATLLRMPFTASLIMARIQWQALHLRVRKKIYPMLKPTPSDPETIPSPRSSIWYSIRNRLIQAASLPSNKITDTKTTKDHKGP